jgi:hypothetical protein
VSSPTPSNPTSTSYQRHRFNVARHGAKGDRNPERAEIDREADLEAPVPPEVRQSARIIQITIGVLLLAALGAVAAFGGFERAGVNRGLPAIQTNELFTAGIWDITVESATAGKSLRDFKAEEGNYLIEIDVTAVNHYTRSRFVTNALELKGITGLVAEPDDPDRVFYIRDNRLAAELEPDLPERIAFVWEVKGGTPVPKQLDVVVYSDIPKVASFQVDNQILVYHDPAATVVVPVTDRTQS